MMNICVLVSGGGTNLQSLIDAVESGEIKAKISGVISSKPGVYALERAGKHGIPSCVISRKDYETKQAFDQAILEALSAYRADLIVLAGYLAILGENVIHAYPNRIINIHPALLPSFGGKGYYGLRVHEAVLSAGVKLTGATVHFVDEGTDTGPIIMQKAVEVLPTDTPEELQARVLKQAEHIILPKVVRLLTEGKIHMKEQKVFVEENGQ
jgi:phosphoribosylglycinamide formyltransferase-1